MAQENVGNHKAHQMQVATWKRQAIDGLPEVFSDKAGVTDDNEAEMKICSLNTASPNS